MFSESALAEIKQSIVDRMKSAPAYLTYHNLAHTLDVAEQVVRIAKEEKVNAHEMLLLEVAALYHDIGYLDGPQIHEERGRALFSLEANNWNFSQEEISSVNRLILATRVPHHPKDLLEQIMCDADLDYLGREDFLTLGAELKKEYLHFGIVKSEEEWERKQILFLKEHRYFTKSSQALREPRKQDNVRLLLT